MTAAEPQDLDWGGYCAADWQLEFKAGAKVLDVGCGAGRQMVKLQEDGVEAVGVELDRSRVACCQAEGLAVVQGRAEALPFPDAKFGGVLCKVVLPYTIEDRAVAEIGRVLQSEGVAYLVGHGAGYSVRYLLAGPTWKQRFYGARTLVNTWLWIVTSWRLPGFLGDTLYQSARRLARHYSAAGLVLERPSPSATYCGFPVFLHHRVRRRL